jgi:hypothetical protein
MRMPSRRSARPDERVVLDDDWRCWGFEDADLDAGRERDPA